MIALLEKIFHLSLLEKPMGLSGWMLCRKPWSHSNFRPQCWRQVTGSEVNSAPDVAFIRTIRRLILSIRDTSPIVLCERAKLPRWFPMTGYPVQGFVLLDHLLVAMIERSGVECIRMGTSSSHWINFIGERKFYGSWFELRKERKEVKSLRL